VTTSRVRVEITPGSLGTRFFIDDQPVSNLRAILIHAAIDEPSTVVFEMAGVPVEVVGDVDDAHPGLAILDVSHFGSSVREFQHWRCPHGATSLETCDPCGRRVSS
jgi:hypothetical protein